MKNPAMPVTLRMKTPQVSRLHLLAKLIDRLDRDLDRVEFLEDDIVDQRKFREVQDLTKKAKTKLTGTRDVLAKHGGSKVAEGYR